QARAARRRYELRAARRLRPGDPRPAPHDRRVGERDLLAARPIVRVFLAALAHETNTFAPIATTRASFEEGLLHHRGDAGTLEKARQFAGYNDALEIARARGDECIAGLCAWAQPGGPLPRADYEALRDELLADLRTAGRVDFVFLVLHGAMVAQGPYWDCEGDILRRVRAIVGEATPVGALLDLHGN